MYLWSRNLEHIFLTSATSRKLFLLRTTFPVTKKLPPTFHHQWLTSQLYPENPLLPLSAISGCFRFPKPFVEHHRRTAVFRRSSFRSCRWFRLQQGMLRWSCTWIPKSCGTRWVPVCLGVVEKMMVSELTRLLSMSY